MLAIKIPKIIPHPSQVIPYNELLVSGHTIVSLDLKGTRAGGRVMRTLGPAILSWRNYSLTQFPWFEDHKKLKYRTHLEPLPNGFRQGIQW